MAATAWARRWHIAPVGLGALVLLSGCFAPEPNWYEQRCLHSGMQRGTPAFERCVERDAKWVRGRASAPTTE